MVDCDLPPCSPKCSSEQFACSTGECLPRSKVCNRIPDCPLHDDEHHCGPMTKFIPLVNSFNPTSYQIDHRRNAITWSIRVQTTLERTKSHFLHLDELKTSLRIFDNFMDNSDIILEIIARNQGKNF